MLSILVLVPVLLLLLAALGILILQQTRPSIGISWLIAALAGLITTGLVIFLRWKLPLELVADTLQPFPGYSSPRAFRLDANTWAYALSLVVLALAFILTDAARLETEGRPMNWAAGLAIIAMGLFAVMAANPVTLVLTWTAVDLVEFLMVAATPAGRRMAQQTVIMFGVRVAGTLLVIAAVLIARSQNVNFDLSTVPQNLAIFLLIAAGLRLGVLPLNLPYTREVYAWRGLGNVLRMIGPASSLVLLAHLPEQVAPPEWKVLLLSLSALAAVYGAAMWLAVGNELNGRPYWLASLAALAVASEINGNPQASIAWGVTLLLNGSVLFFFSARRKTIYYIPVLAAIGITGLPFSPASAGWAGLISPGNWFLNLLFLITIPLLIWGFLRHLFHPREELYRLERWVHTVYPAGLLFLVVGQWVIGVFGVPGSLAPGVWWASISMAIFTGLGITAAVMLRSLLTEDAITRRWITAVLRPVGSTLSAVFRLNWLYRFLLWIYQVLQNIVQLLAAMVEGDGGILWSLVILALLISLIWSGVTP